MALVKLFQLITEVNWDLGVNFSLETAGRELKRSLDF